MRFHKVLEDVVGRRSNLTILRLLSKHETELTGRQIAGLTGLSHRTCQLSLGDLVTQDIVKSRRVGQAILYKLVDDNIFVAAGILPILRTESSLISRLSEIIRESIEIPGVVSILIFGSVAEGKERPDSDIDLCVITRDKRSLDKIAALDDDLGYEIMRVFGNQIALYPVQQADFRRRHKEGDPLIKNIVANHILVAGKSPQELLNGA